MKAPQRQAGGTDEATLGANRLRRGLSPDLLEVLNILDALEEKLGPKPTAA